MYELNEREPVVPEDMPEDSIIRDDAVTIFDGDDDEDDDSEDNSASTIS